MTKEEYFKVPVYSRKGVVGYMKVDKEDFELANSRKWYLNVNRYACYGTGSVKKGTYRKVFFHREIIQSEDGYHTDHINRDTLDNRKSNLRVVTSLQNQMNKRGYIGRSSKFKGVTWDKEAKKWAVRIMLKGKQFFAGRFNNEKEAAKAYNVKSKELFGEFAYQNKIE